MNLTEGRRVATIDDEVAGGVGSGAPVLGRVTTTGIVVVATLQVVV